MIDKRAGCLLVILAAILAFPQVIMAQSFDAGDQAYDRGDYVEALQHWRPLAEDGHVEAQYWLGHMYAMGEGVRRDDVESTRWFRLAAEQGDVWSQAALVDVYWDGMGVRQDLVLAHKWALLSAPESPTSKTSLRLSRKEMTAAQIKKAEKLAREWAAKRK